MSEQILNAINQMMPAIFTFTPILIIIFVVGKFLHDFAYNDDESNDYIPTYEPLTNAKLREEMIRPKIEEIEEMPETLEDWECQNCLALNPITVYQCHVCGAPKRREPNKGN